MSEALGIRGPARAAPPPHDAPERAGGRGTATDGEAFGDVLDRSLEALDAELPPDEDDASFDDALEAEGTPVTEVPEPPPAVAQPCVIATPSPSETTAVAAAAVDVGHGAATVSAGERVAEPRDVAAREPMALGAAVAGAASIEAAAITSPIASRIASRIASPIASPIACPIASPIASAIASLPAGVDAMTPVAGHAVTTPTATPTTAAESAGAGVPIDALPPEARPCAAPAPDRDPSAALGPMPQPSANMGAAPAAPGLEAPAAGEPGVTSETPMPSLAAPPADAAAPREPTASAPIQLSRAEDLTAAIERLRPIPRGGAMLEVEAPGLGAIRLHVAMHGETVRIRIHVQANTDAMTWFAREHEGLCSAARQAVPEGAAVDLQLQCGADDRRDGSSARGHTGLDDEPAPAPPTRPASKLVTPAASPSRSLVDVIA